MSNDLSELMDDIAQAQSRTLRLPSVEPMEIVTLTMSVASRDLIVRALRSAAAPWEEALKPFADFADARARFPADAVITNGSSFAKRQLTMGDCYRARAVLAATQVPQ